MTKTALHSKKCVPCEGRTARLKPAEVKELIKSIKGWNVSGGKIMKKFEFSDYYETTAFVSAAAWIAHREDHHPDIAFGYKQCEIAYSTHSVKGLTLNDFICAAKIDALLAEKD